MTVFGVEILAFEDIAIDLNGVVNFCQNLIWNEQEWKKQTISFEMNIFLFKYTLKTKCS